MPVSVYLPVCLSRRDTAASFFLCLCLRRSGVLFFLLEYVLTVQLVAFSLLPCSLPERLREHLSQERTDVRTPEHSLRHCERRVVFCPRCLRSVPCRWLCIPRDCFLLLLSVFVAVCLLRFFRLLFVLVFFSWSFFLSFLLVCSGGALVPAPRGGPLRSRLLERFNRQSLRLLLQQMLPPSAVDLVSSRLSSRTPSDKGSGEGSESMNRPHSALGTNEETAMIVEQLHLMAEKEKEIARSEFDRKHKEALKVRQTEKVDGKI